MPAEGVTLWLEWLTRSSYHLDVLWAPGSRPVCHMHLDVQAGGPGSAEVRSGVDCHRSGGIQLFCISQSLELSRSTFRVSAEWREPGRRYSRVVSIYPAKHLSGTEVVLVRIRICVPLREEYSQISGMQTVWFQYCCLMSEHCARGG